MIATLHTLNIQDCYFMAAFCLFFLKMMTTFVILQLHCNFIKKYELLCIFLVYVQYFLDIKLKVKLTKENN